MHLSEYQLMTPINLTISQTEKDLKGILSLQKANHLHQVDSLEEGFVFAQHDLGKLQNMQKIAPHVIAKTEDKVVGYVLAMTQDSREDVPELAPMFELFEDLKYQGKKISSYHCMIVGQTCIAKEFRGLGILRQLYEKYRELYVGKYDLAITEISSRNIRSQRAHEKMGFKEIHRYTEPGGEEWVVVIWDWKMV